jgi:hypothetical protein
MACRQATATTHQLCDVAQALRQDYERFDRRVPVADRFQHLLQLEERMGFVHAFRPLGADETRHILACQWPQLGVINPDGDFTDAEAIAAIIRITARLVGRTHQPCYSRDHVADPCGDILQ